MAGLLVGRGTVTIALGPVIDRLSRSIFDSDAATMEVSDYFKKVLSVWDDSLLAKYLHVPP